MAQKRIVKVSKMKKIIEKSQKLINNSRNMCQFLKSIEFSGAAKY